MEGSSSTKRVKVDDTAVNNTTVYLRNLPSFLNGKEISSQDIINLVIHYQPIKIYHNLSKGTAFIAFPDKTAVDAVLKFFSIGNVVLDSSSQPLPIRASLSRAGALRDGFLVEDGVVQEKCNIIKIEVSQAQSEVSLFTINSLVNPYGKVCKIILFRWRNSEIHALVGMELFCIELLFLLHL